MTNDAPAMRCFGEAHGDLTVLEAHAIGVLGYGNQGRAQALNLRDSGVKHVTVGTQRDETWEHAERDGFAVAPVNSVADASNILMLLLPDEELPAVFTSEIAPRLHAGDALVFASGYNLAFGDLGIRSDVDVLLLAPRMIGRQVRELFEESRGFYSYVSVERDATGSAWPVLLALAKGIGTLSANGGGAFELSARDEAVLDLFHEQGFGSLLGATMMLLLDVGMEAGLPPEALVLDYYLSGEMSETFQAMADLGFYEQSNLHSRTSQYGGMMRTIGLDREPIRQHLADVMQDIRSGEFARRWAAEQATGCENFERLRGLAAQANPFSAIEARLHEMTRRAQSGRA
jgi:ketol-acid reductoisomerase